MNLTSFDVAGRGGRTTFATAPTIYVTWFIHILGKVVFICLGVSVNLVHKFQGKPGTTTVKHDFNPNGLRFHRGSPWVSILSWLNLKANRDYFSYEYVWRDLFICDAYMHTIFVYFPDSRGRANFYNSAYTMCDMTHSYVICLWIHLLSVSQIAENGRSHMCDMTHS